MQEKCLQDLAFLVRQLLPGKNWNPFYCWTLIYKPNSCTTQKHQTHGYKWSSLLLQTAYCHPVRPPMCTTGPRVFGASIIALIRMCVVPYCCQWLSQLILWIESVSVTYWRHSTAVCVLMESITRLSIPTCPHHPSHILILPHSPPIMCHHWYHCCCKKVA